MLFSEIGSLLAEKSDSFTWRWLLHNKQAFTGVICPQRSVFIFSTKFHHMLTEPQAGRQRNALGSSSGGYAVATINNKGGAAGCLSKSRPISTVH
jgi:hypothetical protein